MRDVLTHMPDMPHSVPFPEALFHGGRLTTSRSIAFDRMAELVSPELRLEIWPVQPGFGELLLPFRLDRAEVVVEAALQLDAHTQPPPLRLQPGTYEPLVADAWAIALLGAAQLLCPEPTGDANSLPVWDDRLEATADTERVLNAAVAGHIRHYRTRTASADARARAAALGIHLAPHETWVRPYTRGQPAETFLRFHWRPHLIKR
jgi:hypothetical protein